MPLADLQALFQGSTQNASQAKGLTAAYQVLKGGVPTIDGYTFLINENNNTNFGAGASGPTFNDENIYINVMNALYQGDTEAKATFDAIVAGGATLQDKLVAVYNNFIPAAQQTDAGRAYFTSQADFYTTRAAELGIAGSNGASLVAAAALIKIAVDNDIPGIGDNINDLLAAVQDGSAQIPQSGTDFTPIETADGTNYDSDDASSSAGQTFTLTQSGPFQPADNINGTAQDDTFNGLFPGSLQTGDVLNGMGGNDTLVADIAAAPGSPLVPATGTEVPTLIDVENIKIVDADAGVEILDLSQSSGYTNLTAADHTIATSGTTFLNINSAGANLAVRNVGASVVTSSAITFSYTNAALAAAADAVALELNNVGTATGTTAASGPTVTITGGVGATSGAETVNVNATGNARLAALNVFDDATGPANNVMTALNITGAGNVRIDSLDFAGTGAVGRTIDASTATGNVNITLADAENITFTGGAGADRLNTAGTLTTADVLDGGAGRDTLAVTTEAQIVSGLQTSNFEAIELTGALGGTLITSRVGATVDTVVLAGGGTGIINGLASGGTVAFAADAGAVTVNVNNATLAGTTDTLNIVLNDQDVDGFTNGQVVAGVTATGVENININSTGVAPGAGIVNTLTALNSGSLRTLTITGDEHLTITGGVNGPVETVNASAFTGNLNINITGGAAAGVTVTGGSGNDSLFGSASRDVIDGGAGNDLISGDPSMLLTPGTVGAPQINTFQITNVESGDTYTININGTNYSYTATGADTATTVANQLATLIGTAGGDPGTPATNAADTVTVTGAPDGSPFTWTTNTVNRPAGPEVSSVDIANEIYDAGDQVQVTISGTNYTFTAVGGETGVQVATALTALINGGPLMTAATSGDGTVIDLTGVNPTFNYTVSASMPTDNTADTATVLSYTLANNTDLAAGEQFTLILNGSAYSIPFAGTQDTTMATFVATYGAAVNGQTGGTLAYAAGSDQLTITRADGQPFDNGVTAANSSAAILGGNGGTATESFTAGVALTDNTVPTVTDNAPVTVGTDSQAINTTFVQGEPGYVLTGGQVADILTGGAGNDTFVIFSGATIGAGSTVDTITDLNVGGAGALSQVDTVDLFFPINGVVNGGVPVALTSAPTLAAAVNTAFAPGGALNGQANTAGLFTYGGETYLIAQQGVANTFGADDVIVQVTGVTGTLDVSDFV